MNLFYSKHISDKTKTYTFDKDESRHISRVLRKNIGDPLHITNGKGYLFRGKIIDNNPKKTIVEIKNIDFKPKKTYSVHIAIAPTKSNDRIEWFLEKATEIGIDEISLLLTEHSERKKVNPQRYKKIIIAAMKQSLQTYKPTLNTLIKYNDFIEHNFDGYQKAIAYCKADLHLEKSIEPKKNVVLLIGPEGGFSEEEFHMAFDKGFIPVKLSQNRLRTETAGIVGVQSISSINV